MDAHAAKRLATILAEHQETILEEWTRLVRESLRGRMTKAELGRLLEEMYGAHAASAPRTPPAPAT